MSELTAREGRLRRWWPEIALLTMAACVFLGRLGAMDLWGKREQRAVAEALNTVDEGNWLVAYIQSRPRLEKPPLPRWTIATLMTTTGIREEWLMRLPSAFTAFLMVGLTYSLGRRMAGREVGLASGLILTSMFFFVVESRQAGNDGPLAFFTTLAIYAAFRRLHGVSIDEPAGLPAEVLGSKGWAVLLWAAMGLGFLSKGPIAVLLPALGIVPYLLFARRLGAGLKALFSLWGLLIFLFLSLSWPVLVMLNDKEAARIWWLEMGQKAGTAGITHHRERWLLMDWPTLTAPWTLLATWGLVAPFIGRGKGAWRVVSLAWFWAVANFAMFCVWSVAKPNYYVPCEPAVALIAGVAWANLLAMARDGVKRASRFVQLHWLFLALVGVAWPAVIIADARGAGLLEKKGLTREVAAALIAPSVAAGLVVLTGIALSVTAWRKKADRLVLTSIVGGIAAAMTIGYAAIVPQFNEKKSHRALAVDLERMLPDDAKTVMFFRELDEGLWFYLKGHALEPVPGSVPYYSKSFELLVAQRNGTLIYDDAERNRLERKVFVDWLEGSKHESPYVLMKASVYDLYNPGLDAWVEPVFRETKTERSNPLILLRVKESVMARGEAKTTR